MGAHQKPLLIRYYRTRYDNRVLLFSNGIGEFVYYIGKTLELMGIACLGAALLFVFTNPLDYSESKLMGIEMGLLTLGILIFFVGRLIEKRS